MPTIVCFSHLRWNFVYQRPQHIMSRLATRYDVYFIEEPVFDAPPDGACYSTTAVPCGVQVIVPHLPAGLTEDESVTTQRRLLDALIENVHGLYLFWYYSPLAVTFSRHLDPSVVLFDCMDELSAFRFAPAHLKQCEEELLRRADLVFTGGYSLYLAKKNFHRNIFCFPSSIDKQHFALSRRKQAEPPDQADIPGPRLGFFGVVDERFDTALLAQTAGLRPGWQFVIIGPVVKINASDLPQRDNIHYLGMKQYKELPVYLAGWDIAIMPFALNESTRFISPTKTPEYLAGGKPVISTPIKDVVLQYGEKKMVRIADTAEAWVAAGEELLRNAGDADALAETDRLLAGMSWDATVQAIQVLIKDAMSARRRNKKNSII